MPRKILGKYPFDIIERDNEIIIRFYPKTIDAVNPESECFNLRFNIIDKDKRKRIKEIADELVEM